MPDIETVRNSLSSRTMELKLRARWELALRDPAYFLQWFVYTLDTHDKEHPIKPFPWHKQHLRLLVDLWKDNYRLSIVKCRQVVATWLFSALCLWEALHPGKLIMLQSKKEEDAIGSETLGDGPLGRAKFIFSHIPGRKLLCPTPKGSNEIGSIGTHGRLEFVELNSGLWAIAQGGDIIRQRTATTIFSDEAAFQPEAEDAYVAAMPCIRDGGRYIALSTASLADGGHTRRLHLDELDEVR